MISQQTVTTTVDRRTSNLTPVGSHKNKIPIHIQNVSLIFIPSMCKYELSNGRRVGRVLRHLCTLCAHEDIYPAHQYHRQGLQQASAEYKSLCLHKKTRLMVRWRQCKTLGSEKCSMMVSALLGECSRGLQLSSWPEFLNSVIGGHNYDELS